MIRTSRLGYPSLLILLCTPLCYAQLELSAGLELGYDTDVTVDEIDLTTEQSDRFYTGSFGLGYEWETAENQNIKLAYRLTDKRYADYGQFDLQNHMGTANYSYKGEDLTFTMAYRYVSSRLDSQAFLDLWQLSPSVSWFITKQHYVRLAYSYQDKSLENNPGRDGKQHELGGDYYYFADGLNRYWVASAKVRQEDAEDNVFDYRSVQFRLGYQFRFDLAGAPLKTTLDWKYRQRNYDEVINPSIGEEREDSRHTIGARLEWEWSKSWNWQVQAEYLDNESNLPSLSYSQWMTTVGLEYTYE